MPAKWRGLLASLPGYDPFGAAGCWFDRKAAQKALDFFPECIRHVEGDKAGQPFVLERWQQAIVANLFGWKREDSEGREVRRYREAFIYVPRKNGKSPMAAAIGLLVLFTDTEIGQQNFIAASTTEQAGKLFRQCKGMVEREDELSSRCRVYGGNAAAGQSKSIVKNADLSFLQVIAGEAEGQHGGTTHLAIVDELHAQPNRDLADVLQTSLASLNRKQPLLIWVTTADFMRESICNEKYDYACKVRDRVVDDPHFLPVIYEALVTDDWKASETWDKANPNLGVSVNRQFLESECRRAQEVPGYENTFKRLHLNMRTEQDVRWLSLESWDACGGPVDADLSGRDCFIGMDLANTTDMASTAKLFPPRDESEPWRVLMRFWVPEEACKTRERKNKTRLGDWVRRGFITQTDGDEIDYSAIRASIREDAARYRILGLAFDPWNATQLANELTLDGIEVIKFTQSIGNYNEACKRIEELLAGRKLAHGGNPVLRWMAANVAVHTDGRGYKMPSRKKSTEKIDGIVALLMAIALAVQQPETLPSVYETRGLETISEAKPAPVPAGGPLVNRMNWDWLPDDD